MSSSTWISGVLAAALLSLSPTTAPAAPDQNIQDIPPVLKEWISWVLDGEQSRLCVLRSATSGQSAADYSCLSISVSEWSPAQSGVSVVATVVADQTSWLPLPGGSGSRPQEVVWDGQPAVVEMRQNAPHVKVPAGTHRLSLRWSNPPDSISWPDPWGPAWSKDKSAMLPQRDGAVLWRTQSDAVVHKAPPDSIDVRVWRRWDDSAVPLLTTKTQLTVTGVPRTLHWDAILPPGYEAISWTGNIPVSWSSNSQRLTARVAPGVWEWVVTARCLSCVSSDQKDATGPSWMRPKVVGPWPTHEVWSIAEQPDIRQWRIDGTSIDPAQAGVPPDWAAYPSFKVGETPLHMTQVSRGRREGEGVVLSLDRTAWKDASGWVVKDVITGKWPTGGRLTLGGDYDMQSVTINNQPWPISQNDQGIKGINWPGGPIQLVAQVRTKDLKLISGWSMPIDNVNTTIVLPPGSVFLGEVGHGVEGSSWISAINIWVLFWSFLVGWSVRHVVGWKAGVLTAGLMIASGGSGPVLVMGGWMCVALCLHLVIQKINAPRAGRFIKWMRTIALIFALLTWLPWAVTTVRAIVYPHLEAPSISYANMGITNAGRADGAEVDAAAPGVPAAPTAMMAQDAPAMNAASEEKSAKMMLQGSLSSAPAHTPAPLPVNSLDGVGHIQAGDAEPLWGTGGLPIGQSHAISHQGPITATDTTSIWVSDVNHTRAARILGVIGWIAVWLALWWWWSPATRNTAPPKMLRWWVSLVVVAWAGSLSAQTPSAEQLAELKARLTRAPVCAPQCIAPDGMHVDASGATIRVVEQLSAAHRSTWVSPRVEGLDLRQATVNGSPAQWIGVSVLIPQGHAQVVWTYDVREDSIAIAPAPGTPRATENISSPWSGTGVRDEKPEQGGWSLQRQAVAKTAATASDDVGASDPEPIVVHVDRRVDWGPLVTMTTTVYRTSGQDRSGTSLIPRVPGENPQQSDMTAEGPSWQLSWTPGQSEQSWTSRLDITEHAVNLAAIPASTGSERWRLTHTPVWSIDISGVPDVSSDQTGERQFLPLPGEKLTMSGVKLTPASGADQRVNNVHLSTNWGPREAEHDLAIAITATQAGTRTITLPASSSIVAITRSGRSLSTPASRGVLVLPVERGDNLFNIRFRTATSVGIRTSPSVRLDGLASNVTWSNPPGDSSWVLWASGPGWGTSTLYWSHLLVMLIVAFLASRWPRAGVSLRDAMVLVIGFSVLTSWGVLVLAVWRACVVYRSSRELSELSHPKLHQLGLAALSVFMMLFVLGSIAGGLLGMSPDMLLRAPFGMPLFDWYVGRDIDGILNGPTVLSVPIWVYRTLLCIWTLWFARWMMLAVMDALKAWTQGGHWPEKPLPPAPVDASSEEQAKPSGD